MSQFTITVKHGDACECRIVVEDTTDGTHYCEHCYRPFAPNEPYLSLGQACRTDSKLWWCLACAKTFQDLIQYADDKDDDGYSHDVATAAEANAIWLNAFALIRPTEAFTLKLGQEVLRMLKDRSRLHRSRLNRLIDLPYANELVCRILSS